MLCRSRKMIDKANLNMAIKKIHPRIIKAQKTIKQFQAIYCDIKLNLTYF